MKKTYEVELRRTSFITMMVDAPDKETAEQSAWAAVESGYFGQADDASWDVESIEEVTNQGE